MSLFSRLANLWKGFINIFIADEEPPSASPAAPRKEPIVREVNGKKLSILGAEATGKTRLWDYLTKDLTGQGYKVTIVKETEERTFELDGQRITLAKSYDLGGDIALQGTWKTLYDTSDILFYLVNGDLLHGQDRLAIHRVEADLSEIRNWREKDNLKKPFIIVVTWCDKIDTYRDNLPRQVTNDKQLLKNLKPLTDSVLTMGSAIVLGSTEPDKIHQTAATIFGLVRVYK